MPQRRVLYAGAITKIDPATFTHLGGGHARDATTLWFAGAEWNDNDPPVPGGETTLEPDVDPPVEPAGYTIVGDRVHYHDELEGADAATFRTLGHLFAKDSQRVYFDGVVVENADAETFVVLPTPDGCAWARDREHVWHRQYLWHDHWDGEILNEVVGADPESFEALDGTFGRDRAHVWRGGARVEGARTEIFRVLGNGWTRDASTLWYAERRVAADPGTLVIHGDYAILMLAEPALEVIGDGYARDGEAMLFAGYTIEASGPARSLGGGYLVDATGACHYQLATQSLKVVEFSAIGGRLDSADPATLRRDRGFAIDRASVFSGCQRLAGVTASEFRALDAHHGTDGQVAYFDATRIDCDPRRLRTLGGTFKVRGYTLATLDVIDDAWATDGTTLFVQGRPVWDRTARYLSEEAEAALRQLDVARLTVLDPWWATDSQLVLELRAGHVVEVAHAPSFEVLGDGYARDISHVWSRDDHLAADPASFRVLADGYAHDGAKVWFRGQLIADARELRVLGGGWARDATGILCGATRVAADPETFVVVGSATAAEGSWDPDRLELDDPVWLGERVAVGRDLDRLWWGAYSGSTPATAVAIGHGYTVDATRVWHAGTPVDADGTTFVAVGGGYARDAFRAYFHERVTR